MKLAAILIVLLLSACHTPSVLRGSGVEIDPPWGYTDYCQRHPDAVECGAKK